MARLQWGRYLVAALLVLPGPAHPSGLSDITGIDIDIPAGRISVGPPNPGAIPRVISNLPTDAQNFFLNPAGSGLALLIRNAEAQALGSSRPIPPDIRDRLAPYFPTRILDVARFTTVSESGVNIASGVLEANQNVAAFTANVVVIFRNANSAQDVGLWAHELVHVTQYQNMGIEGFAAMYAGWGAQTIEHDAYSWQDYVTSSIQSGGSASTGVNWSDTSSREGIQRWLDFVAALEKIWPLQRCVSQRRIDAVTYMVRNSCPVLVAAIGAGTAQQNVPLTCKGEGCLWDPNTEHVISIRPQDAQFNATFYFLYTTRDQYSRMR
jgi:hypothetical protein